MTNPTQKKSLVERVLAIFKGGDEARIHAFYAKLKRTFESSITKLEANLANAEFNYNNQLRQLQEKHEDAVNAQEAAF